MASASTPTAASGQGEDQAVVHITNIPSAVDARALFIFVTRRLPQSLRSAGLKLTVAPDGASATLQCKDAETAAAAAAKLGHPIMRVSVASPHSQRIASAAAAAGGCGTSADAVQHRAAGEGSATAKVKDISRIAPPSWRYSQSVHSKGGGGGTQRKPDHRHGGRKGRGVGAAGKRLVTGSLGGSRAAQAAHAEGVGVEASRTAAAAAAETRQFGGDSERPQGRGRGSGRHRGGGRSRGPGRNQHSANRRGRKGSSGSDGIGKQQ